MKVLGTDLDVTFGIDPVLGGKLLAIGYVAQGLLLSLATKQQCDFYGWGDSKEALFIAENIGGSILTTGVVASTILFQEGTVHEALFNLGIVWMIVLVRWYLNDTFKQVGYKKDKAVVITLSTLLTMYAGYFTPDWADMVILGIIVFYILVSSHAIFMPETASKFWCTGIDESNKKMPYLVKHFHYFFLAQQVIKLLLVQGVEAHKAIGYASLVGLFFFYDGFFGSKGIVETLKPKPGYLFLIIWFSFFCADILLQ